MRPQYLKNDDFITGFSNLQADAAAINRQSGFTSQDELIGQFETWLKVVGPQLGVFVAFTPLVEALKQSRAGLKLALATGEISEALEAVRKNKGADDHIPEFSAEEAEIADVIIRLMNYATDRKLRLAEAIVAKNEYNRTRHDHTREGRAAANGKKF